MLLEPMKDLFTPCPWCPPTEERVNRWFGTPLDSSPADPDPRLIPLLRLCEGEWPGLAQLRKSAGSNPPEA